MYVCVCVNTYMYVKRDRILKFSLIISYIFSLNFEAQAISPAHVYFAAVSVCPEYCEHVTSIPSRMTEQIL